MTEYILLLVAVAATAFYFGTMYAYSKAHADALEKHSKLFSEIVIDMEKFMSVACLTEFRKIRAAYMKRHNIDEGIYGRRG